MVGTRADPLTEGAVFTMSATHEILQSLPLDQLAQQVGANPQEVEQAAAAAIPALLGGLDANASDPKGAASILEALGQHQDTFGPAGADVSNVDTGDGAKIASHIFGDNEDAVYNQLGGLGAGSGGGQIGGALVKKLIPILAPIVLSYIANQVLGKVGGGNTPAQTQPGQSLPQPTDAPASGNAGAPGGLQDLLKDVLGGAVSGGAGDATTPQQTPARTNPNAGSIIGEILGGLLGGGRR